MNNKKLLKAIKEKFAEEHYPIDFRSDVYLDNQHGLSPCINYDRAREIVTFVYDWAHDYIDDNEDDYPDFSGWLWNLDMAIEELRINSASEFMSRIIDDLVNHRAE